MSDQELKCPYCKANSGYLQILIKGWAGIDSSYLIPKAIVTNTDFGPVALMQDGKKMRCMACHETFLMVAARRGTI
jgi:DNA-directed RNA polymerase subunit RPC12/RpoP